MSIHRSYFNKNNTIISENTLNTGRNPVTDIYYGSNKESISPNGFTRFIFSIDFSTFFSKNFRRNNKCRLCR